jgi:uncharacterized protein (TIGR00369 family)
VLRGKLDVMPKLSLTDIETTMDTVFPDWRKFSRITNIGERDITVRMPFRQDLLRAGGTVSGPALMALADTAAYFLTLAQAGPVWSAATANLDIHFLARPKAADITARATLLRLGKPLSVAAVDMFSSDVGEDLVAHATVTYALPPSS